MKNVKIIDKSQQSIYYIINYVEGMMQRDVLEQRLIGLLNEVDALIADLKKIKNYRCDSLCTDFYRSLIYKRKEIFDDMNFWLNFSEEKYNSCDFNKKLEQLKTSINSLGGTLEYLQSRPPIKNYEM